MTVYRSLVNAGEARRHERGMSARGLSRLTWTADDRAAWNEAYRAAIRIDAVRSAYVLASAHRENDARYSVHVDLLGDAS
jgi:hypothetical protein